MLSDVLIPLRTYPSASSPETVSALLGLASTFATHATLSPLTVSVPDLKHRWAGAFSGLADAGAKLERVSRQAANNLIASAGTPDGLQVKVQPLSIVFDRSPEALTPVARHHDLTMIAYSEPEYDTALAEAALFGTGRPAMLVPTSVPLGPKPFARIAVAWDGTEAASRALHDALPLLVDAEQVIIISAPGEKRIDDGEIAGISDYLVRHGVTPETVKIDLEVLDIAGALQHFATSRDVGLLVMGAFGHNRLQQFLLGGATRGVLQSLRLPVLMSR